MITSEAKGLRWQAAGGGSDLQNSAKDREGDGDKKRESEDGSGISEANEREGRLGGKIK